MASLSLDNLTKIYPPNIRALDSLSLSIPHGQFLVLVGPSGCGKSTTLRLLAGLEDPTAGTIRIADRIVNDLPPKDRDLAMVFQNYALYPHLTVYKNLAFSLKLRGVSASLLHEKVLHAANLLGLEPLLDRKPAALSGGQRQRVALGRAIVRQPSAFLFDEPLSNLDARQRLATRAELKRLHQRLNTTTIYVTHDQEEAMTLGDRLVVLNEGKIQQADTPLETYNCPANRFVAGFIGTPPMNFFDGAIKEVAGRLVFQEGKLEKSGQNTARTPSGESLNALGRLTLPGNGFNLLVPPHCIEVAGAWFGRHVVLGIRPEHLSLRPGAGEEDFAAIHAKIAVIEPLGRDMDLYVETNLHDRVVARVEAEKSLQIGSQAMMYVNLRKIHFFEPGVTGMNLSLTSEFAHAIA